ncbi:Alpha-galactosidase, partial [mine drainage metagenome]
MDPWTLSLIANPEMLTINQDPLGAQGIRLSQHGPLESWAKKLHNGDVAMAIFNRGGYGQYVAQDPSRKAYDIVINHGAFGQHVVASWIGLGLPERAVVRDIWNQRTLGEFNGSVSL